MATIVPHLQKSFKLMVENGLPQATVELMGSALWLRCCPLCGSTHQIQTMPSDEAYTPFCQIHASLYKPEIAAWQKLYPDVIPYTSLHLVEKTA
jgi:hypothetical protein